MGQTSQLTQATTYATPPSQYQAASTTTYSAPTVVQAQNQIQPSMQANITSSFQAPQAYPAITQAQPMTTQTQVGQITGNTIFDMLDRNHDGALTRQEFQAAVSGQFAGGRAVAGQAASMWTLGARVNYTARHDNR